MGAWAATTVNANAPGHGLLLIDGCIGVIYLFDLTSFLINDYHSLQQWSYFHFKNKAHDIQLYLSYQKIIIFINLNIDGISYTSNARFWAQKRFFLTFFLTRFK